MTENNKNTDERISALEIRVSSIQSDIKELSDRVSSIGSKSMTYQAMSKTERYWIDPESEQPNSSNVLIDRLFRADLLMHLATICFILVIALVIRIITENKIIPSNIGAASGIIYCSLLVLYSFFSKKQESSARLMIGVCGLIVLSSIVFEAYKFLHGISLFACFMTLIVGMISSVLLSWHHKIPQVGWIGLLYAPATMAALTFPAPSHAMIFIMLIIAIVITFSVGRFLNLWPARVGLGILAFVFLFYWDRELNGLLRTNPESYSMSAWYIAATVCFTFLFIIPSILSAISRRILSSFEKITPTISIAYSYYLINSELNRGGMDTIQFAQICMAISTCLLAMGVWFGVRDYKTKCGLRTFLGAGVVLLLISSFSTFQTNAPLTVLWSFGALALFGLARYFHSPDLRILSYLIHLFVFIAALTRISFSTPENVQSIPLFLPLFLTAATFSHYLGSRKISIAPNEDEIVNRGRGDGIAVLLLLSAIVSSFLFGRNILLATAMDPNLLSCAQSVWLTTLAAAALYAGTKLNNREVLVIGFIVYGAAAAKVFFFDLLFGLGTYIIVSVLSFGILAGFSSFSMRKALRSNE